MARRAGLLLASLAGVVVLLGAAAAGGFLRLPGSSSTARPACGALPTQDAVAAALREHPEVTSALEASARGVEVSVSRPCSGKHADRALIAVSAPDGATDAVERWLNTHDGYGVPIEVTD